MANENQTKPNNKIRKWTNLWDQHLDVALTAKLYYFLCFHFISKLIMFFQHIQTRIIWYSVSKPCQTSKIISSGFCVFFSSKFFESNANWIKGLNHKKKHPKPHQRAAFDLITNNKIHALHPIFCLVKKREKRVLNRFFFLFYCDVKKFIIFIVVKFIQRNRDRAKPCYFIYFDWCDVEKKKFCLVRCCRFFITQNMPAFEVNGFSCLFTIDCWWQNTCV